MERVMGFTSQIVLSQIPFDPRDRKASHGAMRGKHLETRSQRIHSFVLVTPYAPAGSPPAPRRANGYRTKGCKEHRAQRRAETPGSHTIRLPPVLIRRYASDLPCPAREALRPRSVRRGIRVQIGDHAHISRLGHLFYGYPHRSADALGD